MTDRDNSILKTDNPIFPIINRRAPILERIRGEDNGGSVKDIGELVGEVSKGNEEFSEDIVEDFRDGIADSLGIPQESVSEEILVEFENLFTFKPEDIFTGITPEEVLSDDEEDSDEEEEEIEFDGGGNEDS